MFARYFEYAAIARRVEIFEISKEMKRDDFGNF